MEIKTVDDISSLQSRISVLEPFTHLVEIRRESRDASFQLFHHEQTISELIALFEASGREQSPEPLNQQPQVGPANHISQHNAPIMRLALTGANIPDGSHTHNGLGDAWAVYIHILKYMGFEHSIPADAVKHAVFPPRASSTPGDHYLTRCLRYRVIVNTYDIAWALDSQGVIYGLLRFWGPQATRIASATVRDLWEHKHLAGHHMLLPTLSLFHVAPEMRWWLDKHISGVVEGMRETGFHYNVNIREQEPLGPRELGRHSAILSGHACNLATNKHCWEGLRSLADTVIEECQRTERPIHTTVKRTQWEAARQYIALHASCCARNSTAAIQEADSWQQKAAIQIQAFFSLIAQRDATQSLELANASKIIAEESKKDSTSMKAIAAVTMFFLPGTFLASLFAMPIFDWNAAHGQSVVNPRIWVYFVFAGPITLVTVGSWFVFNHLVGHAKPKLEKTREKSNHDGFQ